MKISIIGSRGYPYVYSGYETFVKELSERLVERGIEVTIYCHANLFEKKPKELNGIKLIYLWTIEKKSISQVIHSFQSMVHSCLSDTDLILVVNSANGPFGLISRIFQKPTAINVDGLEWLRPKWEGLGSKYFYLASKLATKLFDNIINDSDAMRDFYLREFNVDSTVIEYGANIRYSIDPSLIDKWRIKKDDYYLIVGRLIPDNNADLLIREFVNSGSKKKLVVVGDVPYQDDYADSIKRLTDPRLVFTGYVTDQSELAELYHNSFAYLHGHEFGGTNPTMLKALAYGCAILALETPFTREMLDEGKYGKFFKKEVGSLRVLFESLELDEAKILEMKGTSRNRIFERYTWERITDEYIKLFNRTLTKV